MFKKSLMLLAVAGLMAGFASAGSALFTSTATVAANTFTTGTVVITTSPTTALVTFANMAPGDQVTNPLTVSNTGSLDLRYAMTSSSDNTDAKALRDQLVLTIKSGVSSCTNGGFGASGTQVYSGALNGSFFGNPTAGNQTDDRTLAAGVNEALCFHVSLPLSTPGDGVTGYQNATTTATFTFQAEQTANNP